MSHNAPVDTCLPDSDMVVRDYELNMDIRRDWAEKDRNFAAVKKFFSPVSRKYTTHILPEYTPISDQGTAGTCVANAWCDMLEIVLALHGHEVRQLSRLFLYWVARYLHGDTDKDDGTYLRAAAHQLRKIGTVEEKYFPYSPHKVFVQPELDLYTMASNNMLTGFYRIFETGHERVEAIETAIRANHPVVFGAPISKEFSSYRGEGRVLDDPRPSDIVGRHAMCVVGVDYTTELHRRWKIRNSWGRDWGNDGYCWMSDNYLMSFKDIWVGTRMGELY